MCRFAGIWDFRQTEKVEIAPLANAMAETMKKGGPDDSGVYSDPTAGLAMGHRRLAIIDLTDAGRQPMARDHLVIAFNGEIYNHRSLRSELETLGYCFSSQSDTEVILRAFQAWGTDCFLRFSGMFAIALWNKKTHELTLARDRLGVKPLYWYSKDDFFLFASELKAFHVCPFFDRTLDFEAVSLYLQAGYIRSPFSIFRFVRKLEPGTYAVIHSSGTIHQTTYWQAESLIGQQPMTTSDEHIQQEALHILKKGVTQRLVSDVPVGIFLSGGVDSSLLTSMLVKESPGIQTFTMGFDQPELNEVPQAEELARLLNTSHASFMCTYSDMEAVLPDLADIFDEPFGDSSGIPTYCIASKARQTVKVVLSADGGDEVFGGYDRYKYTIHYWNKIRRIPAFLRVSLAILLRFLWTSGALSLLRGCRKNAFYSFSPSRIRKLKLLLRANSFWEALQAMSGLADMRILRALHNYTPTASFYKELQPLEENRSLTAVGVAELTSYLEGDILVKVDRTSMYVGLEVREPFLDNEIVRFGMRLADAHKLKQGNGKWILRKLLASFIPAHMANRPKRGFGVPMDEWLRNRLQNDIRGMAADKLFCETFAFHQAVLEKLVRDYLATRRTLIDPHFIWALFSLYSWYNRWYKPFLP